MSDMPTSHARAQAAPPVTTTPDPAKVEAFAGRVIGDFAATMATVHACLGDKLGLFKDLAACGPQTSAELASCTGTDERYVREWASALACAGYLTHDAASNKFALPAEHAPVLADEGGAAFMAGLHQTLAGCLKVYPQVERAFREGGGVPVEAYDSDLWVGEERSNELWHNHQLVKDWMPRLPEVKAKLEQGADVLDIGTGGGRALVRLAQAFPKSRFTGYDLHGPSIERARSFAKEQGVADRVTFEVRDATQGIPGHFDLITAFDVAHDVQDPPKLFTDARKALRPGGRFVLMELNVQDKLADNAGPIGAMLFGISPFYCMTLSLGRGGAGYGTCGMPPGKVQELAKRGGFRGSRRVDVGSPIQVLYEVTA